MPSIHKILAKIAKIFRRDKEPEEIRCYQKGDWVRITRNDELVYQGSIAQMPQNISKRFRAFCRDTF